MRLHTNYKRCDIWCSDREDVWISTFACAYATLETLQVRIARTQTSVAYAGLRRCGFVLGLLRRPLMDFHFSSSLRPCAQVFRQ